ncbi:Uncharacterized protein FWK35_00028927 [Aphis craccivora]|uniref:Uncharacterized protein n=1 Tax=Aphis craccivora TaxID=307492 RepID=A0A6G0VY21_APHCR|nr:Uncharacterized protein FWK35_00028927 [Aphis craccivora]
MNLYKLVIIFKRQTYILIFFCSIQNMNLILFKMQISPKANTLIYNSERSEECIDFTMMCVFFFVFVSVYSRNSRNNAPISNYGDGFRCKSEYPWCIIEVKSETFCQQFSKKIEKNKKKMTEKREFLRKTCSFRPNRFFFYGCNSKTNHCKYLKFSPNVYVIVIYIQLNFLKILTFFDVDKKFLDDQKVPYEFSNFYEICRKRENLQD